MYCLLSTATSRFIYFSPQTEEGEEAGLCVCQLAEERARECRWFWCIGATEY